MAAGRIFCIMGKSASGKDSLYRAILERQPIPLATIITYTTRPKRNNEHEGVEYHFVDEDRYRKMTADGLVIESRCYHTVFGDWFYFTADDGQIDNEHDYLLIMTLEGYASLRNYFGEDRVIPIYIDVEDGLRLERAIGRERKQPKPAYDEMCRRFLADSVDFSEENLKQLNVTRYFENNEFDTCLDEVCEFIVSAHNGLQP